MAPGDKVQLKSGGPTMMVDKVGDEQVVCLWFCPSRQEYCRATLPAACLVLVK